MEELIDQPLVRGSSTQITDEAHGPILDVADSVRIQRIAAETIRHARGSIGGLANVRYSIIYSIIAFDHVRSLDATLPWHDRYTALVAAASRPYCLARPEAMMTR